MLADLESIPMVSRERADRAALASRPCLAMSPSLAMHDARPQRGHVPTPPVETSFQDA
jgi:hypothetical protein